MAKQHHFVLMYDEADGSLSLDWATLSALFEDGNVFDPESEKWSHTEEGGPEYALQERLVAALEPNLQALSLTAGKVYVARDGNYGDAEGLVILDAAALTAEDWDELDECGDWRRAELAAELAAKRVAH